MNCVLLSSNVKIVQYGIVVWEVVFFKYESVYNLPDNGNLAD